MKLKLKACLQPFICIVAMSFLYGNAFAQSGCAKDDLGRVICSPPGGTAVNSMNGIVCAPGRCGVDDLGHWKCSARFGGGVAKDDLGGIICVGGCINPSKEYCEPEMKR